MSHKQSRRRLETYIIRQPNETTLPAETAAPLVAPIVTGHFREDAAYATWRAHGTSDWLLILTLGGAARFGRADDGGDLFVGPGEIVLLRPGTRHDYGTRKGAVGWELLWTHFLPRAHWLDWLGWPEAAPGLLRLDLKPDPALREAVTRRLFDMHRLGTGALRRRDLFALNALEEALLWCDAANPRSVQAKLDVRVRTAMEFLLQHLHDTVPLDVLAREVGLSVSRVGHLFRQQIGLTPQQFVERERITRAKQLLELSGRTVTAIAQEVGYENPFYFTLRFKKHTGLSPTDWRRRRGTGQNSAPGYHDGTRTTLVSDG